jgi:YegS/Rv2252/BmrU family lipid kinase
MPAQMLLVVNPASKGGLLGRRWPALEKTLRGALGDFEVEMTRGPRDAVRIAREGVRAGVDTVVAVGGDGTASEVVNGILGAHLGDVARVGLIPFGTGGDLARGLGIPSDLDAAVAAIASGKTRRIDAGRVRLQGRDGRELITWFVNVASLGLSGLVTELVNAAPKRLGGRVSFLVGTLRGIARWRNRHVVLRLDGETVHDGLLSLAAAANGPWFGGGMKVAPEARFDDGLLDVVFAPGLAKTRLVRLLPKIYDGSHTTLPEVTSLRGARLEAEAAPGEVWVELDGEPLGTLPATIEVLPGALAWLGEPPGDAGAA